MYINILIVYLPQYLTSDFHMELPEAGDFLDADLAKDNAASIEEIEK
jgi:hypothetical protein